MILREIREFRGEYFFLSNFYETFVEYEGLVYPSAEAAFQAAKCIDINARKIFQTLSPAQAKRHGRQVFLRPDWEEIKLKIMEDILKSKFNNEDIKIKLIGTGSAILIEGNTRNDKFWGVDLKTNKGENHLGKLLMKLRDDLSYSQ